MNRSAFRARLRDLIAEARFKSPEGAALALVEEATEIIFAQDDEGKFEPAKWRKWLRDVIAHVLREDEKVQP